MGYRLADGVFWVGYIDWNLRNFHGYSTPYGSSYGAYLVLDDEPVLIDTVKSYGVDELLKRISAVIEPRRLKYIVSNHSEMDHSGSIIRLLKEAPDAQLIASPNGEKNLAAQMGAIERLRVVKDGEEISIGRRRLKFFHMPMVHWPDSMATYLADDAILFSNDAFGQHIADSRVFADEIGIDFVLKEAKKYYANIVMPYGQQVLGVLNRLASLDISMIAPSHGALWRDGCIKSIVELYKGWASHKTKGNAVIAYDTMWGSTEKIANSIKEALYEIGKTAFVYKLSESHISDIVAEIIDADTVFLGSSVINNSLLPTMYSLLGYIKGLKPAGRRVVPFGSYGWSPIAFGDFKRFAEDAKMQFEDAGLFCRFAPQPGFLEEAAGRAKSICQEGGKE